MTNPFVATGGDPNPRVLGDEVTAYLLSQPRRDRLGQRPHPPQRDHRARRAPTAPAGSGRSTPPRTSTTRSSRGSSRSPTTRRHAVDLHHDPRPRRPGGPRRRPELAPWPWPASPASCPTTTRSAAARRRRASPATATPSCWSGSPPTWPEGCCSRLAAGHAEHRPGAELQQLVRGRAEYGAADRALAGGADHDHRWRRARRRPGSGPRPAWPPTSSTAAVDAGRSGASSACAVACRPSSDSASRCALNSSPSAARAVPRRRRARAARRTGRRPRSRPAAPRSAPGDSSYPRTTVIRQPSMPVGVGRRRLDAMDDVGVGDARALLPEPGVPRAPEQHQRDADEEDADADHQGRADAEPRLAAVGVRPGRTCRGPTAPAARPAAPSPTSGPTPISSRFFGLSSRCRR